MRLFLFFFNGIEENSEKSPPRRSLPADLPLTGGQIRDTHIRMGRSTR